MKYYLFDNNNQFLSSTSDVNTALQTFGEIYDAAGNDRHLYKVEIYLDLMEGKEKFYNAYFIEDFINKSPEAFEATPDQEDIHAEKEKTQEKPKLMTEEERKAFNAGNNRSMKELAESFTDEEYRAVLPCIPTGFIVAEIARRFDEYDKATNGILNILNDMKIYQSDKKGN